jgi:hypothetical protein
MPELPLLRLPTPNPAALPRGYGGGEPIRFPSKKRQTDQFDPLFSRLKSVLSRRDAAVRLRDDPAALRRTASLFSKLPGPSTIF